MDAFKDGVEIKALAIKYRKEYSYMCKLIKHPIEYYYK